MTSKEKIAEIKDIMASSGLWVVGDEIWPYDEFHLVNVASSKADLDPLKLADEIRKRTGVICSPLPKKDSTPNIYTFIAYRATPTATITTPSGPVPAHVYVSDVEDSLEDLGVLLVAVYAYPLGIDIDGAEDLVEAAHAFVRPFTGPEVPTLIADNEPVTPHTWYWLRVTPVGQPPLDTGYVKALLEEQGYKVIAPDKGISASAPPPTDRSTSRGSSRRPRPTSLREAPTCSSTRGRRWTPARPICARRSSLRSASCTLGSS